MAITALKCAKCGKPKPFVSAEIDPPLTLSEGKVGFGGELEIGVRLAPEAVISGKYIIPVGERCECKDR